MSWIASRCQRTALAPGGLGRQIYAAADTGELTEDEASLLVRSFLTAGLDTTVVGLGNALFCFAQHPDQWQRFRQDPSLARAAFDEVLRYESPVQTFFRTTTRPVEVAGVKLACRSGSGRREPGKDDAHSSHLRRGEDASTPS